MSMNTNLTGRVRHTKLPKSNGLLPLFEAVVNSIHSIEEAGVSLSEGRIVVEIVRNTQEKLNFEQGKAKKSESDALSPITGFKIFDNGIGFDETNMESFKTLDSEHKADKGCRGVGRLLWVKAFQRVNIYSCYTAIDGTVNRRMFDFTASSGVCNEHTNPAADAKRETCIHLDGFLKIYRDASRKTVNGIANSLFEHCLWYFIRPGGAPSIVILDDLVKLSLDDLLESHMHGLAVPESILIKNVVFELTHVKLQSNSSQSHTLAFCAANRLVKEENIRGKIPGLYGRIGDENGEFVYACYVSSTYLDENVRSERTGFDIADDLGELFEDSEISLNDIRTAVISKSALHLSDYLQENRSRGRERVETFVSRKAPRYRPILSRIPEEFLSVDPSITDKDLDLALHKHLVEIESQLLASGHDILFPKEREGWSEYQNRLYEYLSTAEDIKKSDLANYVSHRRVILEFLEKAIQRQRDGKYARENLIHNLIMPMRYDTSQVMFDSCNLW